MNKTAIISILMFVNVAAHAAVKPTTLNFNFPPSCKFDSKYQTKKSAELQKLVVADQSDRRNSSKKVFEPHINLPIMDLERRKKIAEIFSEGCINSAEDYYAAALVFQHGDVPDHYYQAYLWADKSEKLGRKESQQLAAMAFDRYLVSIGKKQLFATQFEMYDKEKQCYCMAPVESDLSESKRTAYALISMRDRYKLLEVLNADKGCQPVQECNMKLKSVEHNVIPGVW